MRQETNEELKEKLDLACWIAHKLFDRRVSPGTTGNLSFLQDGVMYITASGTCFGTLKPQDFTAVDLRTGKWYGEKPSKEMPLHTEVYRAKRNAGAVIHVHSTYTVLWSCIPHENETDCVPQYTPYLKMKLGTVGLVPYGAPGSKELFASFHEKADNSDAWILKNHGSVVPGKNLMDAFACTEELEESCHIAWELIGKGGITIENRGYSC